MQGVVFLQINASTDNIHVIKVGDDDALVSLNGVWTFSCGEKVHDQNNVI